MAILIRQHSIALINAAQFEFLDYLLGEFQQYQVGRPVPRVQYSMTEVARQRLTPFIDPPVTLAIDVTGVCAISIRLSAN